MGEGPGGLGERGPPPGALPVPVTMLNLILPMPVTVSLSAVRYSCCLLVLVVDEKLKDRALQLEVQVGL